MSLDQQCFTDGDFNTEELAWETFDSIVHRCQAFRLLKEVPGEYVQPRIGTDAKGARIDRILIPLAKAVQAGWADGAIGIEGKKSGTKIGKLISQGLDYSRCGFEIEQPPGLVLMLRWIFLYPVKRPIADVASIMAQNRIGCAWCWEDRLTFSGGGIHGLVITRSGEIETKTLPMGNKRGSR